jgi:predicted NUDIX family NTP pyrophosphohydrolase
MKTSGGLLAFRVNRGQVEVFIAHMGGPVWEKKDERAWSIPKGELDSGEQPLEAALREFREETGMEPPLSELIELGEFQQSKKKRIFIWASEAGEGELDPERLKSITVEIEWPPKSGKRLEFPEADRADWCDIPTASSRVIRGQVQVLEALEALLFSTGRLS